MLRNGFSRHIVLNFSAYNNIFKYFINNNRRIYVSELTVLAGIDTNSFAALIRKSVGGFKIYLES